MTARTCLVLGGRGFLGSAFAAHARTLGAQVTAVGRADYAQAVGKRFDVVVFAAGNARRYLADRDPAADLDANVGAVYRSISDFATDRFVLASSVDVYPDPSSTETTNERTPIDPGRLSVYGFHKHLAELVTMRHARGFLIVRLGQMVGPGLAKGPIFDALAGDPLRVARQSRYPFLRTSSVAALTFTLIDGGASEAIFNVCGAGSVALADALRAPCASLSGAPLESYEIDVSALAARTPVPRAADEIRAFLEQACS